MFVQVMTFPEQTPSVTASSYWPPARTTSATRRSGGRNTGRSVSFADLSDPEEVEQVEEVEEDIQKEADEEEEAEKEAREIQGFRHGKGSRDAVFAAIPGLNQSYQTMIQDVDNMKMPRLRTKELATKMRPAGKHVHVTVATPLPRQERLHDDSDSEIEVLISREGEEDDDDGFAPSRVGHLAASTLRGTMPRAEIFYSTHSLGSQMSGRVAPARGRDKPRIVRRAGHEVQGGAAASPVYKPADVGICVYVCVMQPRAICVHTCKHIYKHIVMYAHTQTLHARINMHAGACAHTHTQAASRVTPFR